MFYYLAAQKTTNDTESLCVYVVHPELYQVKIEITIDLLINYLKFGESPGWLYS